MTRHTLSLFSILLLAPLAAVAGERGAALDADGDGAVDRSEAAQAPRLAAQFDRLDADGDGRLSAEERPQRGGRHRGHRDLGALDGDGDGRVSRAEFDAGQSANPRRDGQPAPDFAAIDGNRDGYLVRSEWRAYQQRMRPQREAEHAQRLQAKFAEADLNRDGRLSRVEVDEAMPRLSSRFAWSDDNRDGFLSLAELQAGRTR